MNKLIEWNKKINLTAITEPKDIITKHFVDSLTAAKYLKQNSNIVDCGTGAGFPGIPLSIYREDATFLLFDSLNKRILFLEEIIKELGIDNVKVIHARAEDLAHTNEYWENFDCAISRAVANMSTLLEYLLPFCKRGGTAICMKGANIEEEIKNCNAALNVLGGTIEKIDSFTLPNSEYSRNIVLIKKVKNTPNKYPRKQGKPAKEPLV